MAPFSGLHVTSIDTGTNIYTRRRHKRRWCRRRLSGWCWRGKARIWFACAPEYSARRRLGVWTICCHYRYAVTCGIFSSYAKKMTPTKTIMTIINGATRANVKTARATWRVGTKRLASAQARLVSLVGPVRITALKVMLKRIARR